MQAKLNVQTLCRLSSARTGVGEQIAKRRSWVSGNDRNSEMHGNNELVRWWRNVESATDT